MSRTLLRLGVTALSTAALSAVALVPSPAMAGSMFFSKSSGTFASAEWVEVGPLPEASGVPGNGHVGFLSVEQAGRGLGNAFGVVYDLDCPEGAPVVLPNGGGHGEPEPPADPNACAVVMVRKMEGRAMSFTMDNKFSKATLTGTLNVGEHGSGVVGQPPVSITWTGVGATETFTDSSRYSNEFGTGSFRYTSTSRQGVIAAGSRIGPMIFDDEQGETSKGRLGSFRSVSRDRTP